jgi:hypothetical protein
LGYAFEEDGHQAKLRKDGGTFEASDSGFMEGLKIFFGGTINSFRGRSEGSEFLVARPFEEV